LISACIASKYSIMIVSLVLFKMAEVRYGAFHSVIVSANLLL
jgi:hypothetical protein